MKKLLIVMFVLAMPFLSVAQTRVTGTVTTKADGQPVPFAYIVVKGTQMGTSSNEMGEYALDNVPANAILSFSSIGYETVEVAVNGRAIVNVALAPDAESIDETIIVAYGTAKKGTYTGSAALVDNSKFLDRPLTEVTQALAGTTAGLQIGTSNGMPGSEPTIRIRGIGSFNASNSPLIVLDGMPYDNAFTSINPNDIESITVLKDASSSALYGARAANGVLMVTTKKGKAGKMDIAVKYNTGVTQRQTKDYKTLGITDYMEAYFDGVRNGLIASGKSFEQATSEAGVSLMAGMGYNPYNLPMNEVFTAEGKINPAAQLLWADDLDWHEGVERLGKRHDVGINISGANEKTDYYASIGYTNQQGYMGLSVMDRYSAKTNVNSQVTKWLKLGVNLNASITGQEAGQNESSGNLSNSFYVMRYMGNIFPVHQHYPQESAKAGQYVLDAEGNKICDYGVGYTLDDGTQISPRDGFSGVNPRNDVQYRYDGYRRQLLNGKTYAEVTFLKDFKFTANVGVSSNMYRGWSGDYAIPEKNSPGTSTKSNSNTTTWTLNQMLTWNKDFGKHHIDALIGHESYQYEYNYLSASMQNQIIKGWNFEFANYAEAKGIPNSYTHQYRVEGYLSRLNYDYANRFFVSGSYRRDGSSRFHKDVRWGNFWSVGGGWRLDNEKFMKNISWVNMLKLRASYGIVGNDDLDSYYPWRATYSKNPNGNDPGYIQGSLGNPDLTWEESANLDLALEFTLFKNRVNGTIEYFDRKSSNLLFEVPKAYSTGVENVSVNAGTMKNSGVEITFDVDVVRTPDFKWNFNANATFLKNILVELPIDPYNSLPYRIEAGHSRYEFYLKQWAAVNPQDGLNLYLTDMEQFEYTPDELFNIDGTPYDEATGGIAYTESYNKVKSDWSGSAMPVVTGGFGSTFNLKNWALTFNFYYSLGGKFYDNTYSSLCTYSASYFRLHEDVINRWREPGDITNIPKMTNDSNEQNNIGLGSTTQWLCTANMLELTNVNLSYTLPKKWAKGMGINSMKVYFSADNAWLLAHRRGLSPRKNFSSGYASNQNVYMPSRTSSVGININF